MMQTILLTGSNGSIGSKIVELLAGDKEIQMVATSKNNPPVKLPSRVIFERADLTKTDEVNHLVEKYRPAVIIHSAALSKPDDCEQRKEECWNCNILATGYLAQVAKKQNAHLVFLSTDFVFDGEAGPYSETDRPNPLSYYGKSKWEAEKIAASKAGSFAIARTVLVYGIQPGVNRPNLITKVKQALENQQTIKIASDQFRTPTLVDDIAWGTIQLALLRKEGIFHISGPQMMSIYQMAIETAMFFRLDHALIHPTPTKDLNELVLRPLKTGFIIDKARKELNFNPVDFKNGLKMISKSFI